MKQGGALTGRNRTGPPRRGVSAARPSTRSAAGRPARRQHYRQRWQTTTTDTSDRY